MTGDPVTPFLVDLWRFGALAGVEDKSYDYLWENVNNKGPTNTRYYGRSGIETYKNKGFVEWDKNYSKPAYPLGDVGMNVDPEHGASATLEYALADGALSIMAAALGRNKDVETLRSRGRNWENLWREDYEDPEGGITGLFHPKDQKGDWKPPNFDPSSSEMGFQEGSSWHYHWLVQQDLDRLVTKVGAVQIAARLDKFFAFEDLRINPEETVTKQWCYSALSYKGRTYNPNNEPDLHAPWVYTMIGQPWKTAVVTRAAQKWLFINKPDGVTGNDDLGTMSAWYVFSALGLFPFMPGSGQLLLSIPRFTKATITLENGKQIVINALNATDSSNQYITKVEVNGTAWSKVWLDWSTLRNGTTITHTLTTTPPTTGWGTMPGSAPKSPCS